MILSLTGSRMNSVNMNSKVSLLIRSCPSYGGVVIFGRFVVEKSSILQTTHHFRIKTNNLRRNALIYASRSGVPTDFKNQLDIKSHFA